MCLFVLWGIATASLRREYVWNGPTLKTQSLPMVYWDHIKPTKKHCCTHMVRDACFLVKSFFAQFLICPLTLCRSDIAVLMQSRLLPLQQKVQRATTCLIKSHVFPTSRSFNGNLSKLRPSLVWNFERSALVSNYMCEGKHLLCWFWYLGWYRVAIWHKNNIRCNNWVHRNIVEIIVLSETCQESYWEGNWIGRRGVIERFQKLSNLREDHSSMLHMFYISVKIFVLMKSAARFLHCFPITPCFNLSVNDWF